MKTTYEKLKATITSYWQWKDFCNGKFQSILLKTVSTENVDTNCNGLEEFLQMCINILNIFGKDYQPKSGVYRDNTTPNTEINITNEI